MKQMLQDIAELLMVHLVFDCSSVSHHLPVLAQRGFPRLTLEHWLMTKEKAPHALLIVDERLILYLLQTCPPAPHRL